MNKLVNSIREAIVLSGLIRLAFSTIPAKQLPDVFANVDAAVRDLKAAHTNKK